MTVNVFQNTKTFMVKDLRPGMTECGKIKIGQKGRTIKSRNGNEFQPPEKLDHFVVTTLERGQDGNFVLDRAIHDRFGDAPKELPVRLLFNDPWLNFQTTYAAMRGGSRFCTGDGERAERVTPNGEIVEVTCPCERLNSTYDGKDKCKINGTLSVMIDGAEVVGGVWKLRTTSINTCQGIASSLALLSTVTEGNIAGVPLMMTVRPKAAVTPQGATTTVYVVGLEFRGTIDALRQLAHDKALADATFGQRMERIEDQARAMLSAPKVISDDETMDIVDEFYPEEGARARGIPLAERPTDKGRTQMRTLEDFVTANTKPDPAADLVDQQTGEIVDRGAGDPTGSSTEPKDGQDETQAPTQAPDDPRPQTPAAARAPTNPEPDLLGATEQQPEPPARGSVTLMIPGQKRPEMMQVMAASAHLIALARERTGDKGAQWIAAAVTANPWIERHRPTKDGLRDETERCLTGG